MFVGRAMTDMTTSENRSAGGAARSWAPALLTGALVAVELALISLLYINNFEFVCEDRAPKAFCGFLSLAPARAFTLFAALALVLLPHRRAALALLAAAPRGGAPLWLGLNLAGFALLMSPWFFLSDASGGGTFAAAVFLWLAGAAAASAGAALALAPAATWAGLLRLGGTPLFLAIPVAIAAPDLAAFAQQFWKWSPLAEMTFRASAALLQVFEPDAITIPENVALKVGEFGVRVGPQCSGIEGFALISGFTALYIAMFRRDLRFPHVLLLLPIGILLSWVLNVVRIAGLVLLGAHVSPTLAIEGFHSHAGWLMFTLLSLSLAAAAHATPFFRKDRGAAVARPAAAPLPPLAEDWNAARLIPFIAFMATALLASTFFEIPGEAYPLRFVVTLAALLFFWRLLARLDWRIDPLAAGAGVLIGLAWVATAPEPAADDPLAAALAALPLWAFAIWAVCRVLGTSLLVPVVEELLFRSYLQERLNFSARLGPVAGLLLAVGVSTALFAALHDRWIAAGLAGLVFAGFALRRGRIADAIWCHAAANAVIAGFALAAGKWSLI